MAKQRKRVAAGKEAPISTIEVDEFTRAFAQRIGEGKSLVATLSALADEQKNPQLEEVIRAVNVAVRAGHTLSSSMARFPDAFDAAYVAAIRLGEVNGTLDQMLDGLARADDILTLDQAVQFLGTSKPTIYRLLSGGTLKGLRVGRQWRFRKTDLSAYMERRPEPVAVVAAHELDAEYDFFTGRLRENEGAKSEAASDDATSNATSDDDKIIAIDNAILDLALRAGASDIHLEAMRPEESEEACVVLRFRVDGVLQEIRRMPLRLLPSLAGRFKVMAEMNAAQRDVPQDGRFPVRWRERDFDVRVASCPSFWGESVVMRLLDRSAASVRLEELLFSDADLERLREWLARPNGLILFCGPAGSGKTTVLQASLLHLNTPQKKILTIEDPVEWQVPGIVQVAVNRRAGLTFASALRAFLRQDPDIIVASELRDLESAQTVAQAALTGHTVLSTLHLNAAVEAAARLRDLGVEPYLIASSLSGVMSQRLARRICAHCREENAPLAAGVLKRVRDLSQEGGYAVAGRAKFARGRGCEKCHGTGFRGRVPIYELVTWSARLSEAFLRGADADEQTRIAVHEGATTMLADGIRKAVEGYTTPEEVLRVLGITA